MDGVLSALPDPTRERLAFRIGQLLFRVGGRHRIVGRVDADQNQTLLKVVRINGSLAGLPLRRCLEGIQSHLVARRPVWTMTDKTLVRQDRQHVPREVDSRNVRSQRWRIKEAEQEEHRTAGHQCSS